MGDDLETLLNLQINKEFQSAYLYFEFASILRKKSLYGYANYFIHQANEELKHGYMIFDYMTTNDYDVCLSSIEYSPSDIDTLEDILSSQKSHEEYITYSINSIYYKASELDDLRLKNFLEWFIKEQTEEEAKASIMYNEYKLFGDSNLYELDEKYSKREL